MLVLACDTSHRIGSLGLIEDGRQLSTTTFAPIAEVLPSHLAALMQEAARTLQNIDLFAVTIGPGSFTGLRSGLTFMKTLAHLYKKPAVGVSTLAAMVSSADQQSPHPQHHLAPVIHSSGNEYYLALYDVAKNGKRQLVVDDRLAQLAEIPQLLQLAAASLALTGEKLPSLTLPFQEISFTIQPQQVAELGVENFRSQQNLLNAESQPRYLRLSEVERRRGQETAL